MDRVDYQEGDVIAVISNETGRQVWVSRVLKSGVSCLALQHVSSDPPASSLRTDGAFELLANPHPKYRYEKLMPAS